MSEVGPVKVISLDKVYKNDLCAEPLKIYAECVHEAIHACVLDAQKHLKTYETTDFMDFISEG
jgi:hypothetical protein